MQELQPETLRSAMKAIEESPHAAVPGISATTYYAALAGLGSNYLAVGAPSTLALVGHSDEQCQALMACHRLLFGELETIRSSEVGIEEAMAADIVCLPCTTEFSLDWIADATHLNLLEDGPWSLAVEELAQNLRPHPQPPGCR